MLPVRMEESEDKIYHQNLAVVRQRILRFVLRRLVPQHADFAQAEDIAQSCVVTLWEKYPDKRELDEMVGIAIGAARHQVAQFRRDNDKRPGISDWAADHREFHDPQNPHSGERLFEQLAARQYMNALLLALLKLSPRCRQLLTLKLIEQRSYPEIRMVMGISGNIYEMAKRCHTTLLRFSGGIGL
jgi:DNA-directed RNA polymerase specialized sigma24 family protein